jgi:outer membrane cobalamin receptor
MKNAKSIFFSLVSMIVVSCNSKMTQIESPLAIVIKLISAESFANFDEAKKYIDVKKVYSNDIDTLSAEQAWKSQVLFFYNIGKDKKFTNNFKYYNYLIKEEQKGENAEVVFESIHPEESISKILYTLNRHNKTWEVVKIEYIKK